VDYLFKKDRSYDNDNNNDNDYNNDDNEIIKKMMLK
jgi:hypothetical protein